MAERHIDIVKAAGSIPATPTMNILSIETSCDETAISIIETNDVSTATPKGAAVEFKILGNALLSQIKIHKKYGGVFPTLAKREHSKNLIPILKKVLEESNFLKLSKSTISTFNIQILNSILEREPELLEQFLKFIPTIKPPKIDAVAVTVGPGLEPALWVGINFAKTLALIWKKPIVPINHMEGHIVSALLKKSGNKFSIFNFQFPKFPMIALLISGGHTQLVLSKEWLKYEIIGETLDDAVGEAFDKVARMLGLSYPGGPEISKLAQKAREYTLISKEVADKLYRLPRPMLKSETCDFSFSGLKTAVLYMLKKIPNITDEKKKKIALEFEDAVTEVLISKTKKVLKRYGVKTLIIGGGVAANEHIKTSFENMIRNEYLKIRLHIPTKELSTDNAIMIAIAGYFRFSQNSEKYKKQNFDKIRADGNLSL